MNKKLLMGIIISILPFSLSAKNLELPYQMKQCSNSIDQFARIGNCTVDTIRYYEQNGLLPSLQIIESDKLHSSERYQEQLLYIRHSRELGFSLNEIRDFLTFAYEPENLSSFTNERVSKHLETIEHKIT